MVGDGGTMRVLVIDEQPVTREGAGSWLRREGVAGEIADTGDLDTAAALVELRRPHVVLLGDARAIDFIRWTARRRPETRIVVWSAAPLAQVAQAVRAGAHGYVSKSATSTALAGAVTGVTKGLVLPDELRALITAGLRDGRDFGRGLARLTAREREVLHCLGNAYDNKEIASELGIAVRTVNRHLEGIREKTGVRRRSQLMQLARSAEPVPADVMRTGLVRTGR
ncbi:response regulator transcription factor [Pseudonocardia sp. TRM90224]|uniref:response regulator transcription factor n=1 Tax=Pseudonocardia sp. TRM90224 TaxID=2812678 RepID=UPI001E4FB65E|nr:response regulator transcription factor [Pseudonocardia sp. TRM90224]